MIKSSRQLLETLIGLYGEVENTNWADYLTTLKQYVLMYLIDNPGQKVRISRAEYRRQNDGGVHTWTTWDEIEHIMVKEGLQDNIEWVD